MSTDRELLELAAKAYGVILNKYEDEDFFRADHSPSGRHWNPRWEPLTDDGDALRLAAGLGLVVDCSRPSAGPPFYSHTMTEIGCTDWNAGVRRAIVRAAAEIGRTTPAAPQAERLSG